MEISVIVPVAEDPRLVRCLRALFQQAFDPARYEVLVVDNGPSREVRQLAEAFPVRYMIEPEGGSYAARNRAVEEARGELLAFTDADCLPPPDWLSAIRSVFERGACDVAVGPSYALNGDRVGRLVQAVDDQRWARLAQERWITYCDTRNLAGRREVFLQHPFDPRFRHGGDIEWGVQAAQLGYRIQFVPEMILGHENVSSLWAAFRRGLRRGKGMAALYRKHGRGFRISGSRPLWVMGIDVKDRVVSLVTHPLLRPLALASLSVGTFLLLMILGLLLRAPGPTSWARRPFQVFDRATLLLGQVLGS